MDRGRLRSVGGVVSHDGLRGRFAMILVLALLLELVPTTINAWGEGNARLEAGREYPGSVVSITDCDTLRVKVLGVTERLRIVGIDCPESQPNERSLKQAREFGKRQEDIVAMGRTAKRFVEAELRNARGVTIRTHKKLRDHYGRMLGSVILPDGRDLAEVILRNGFAVPLEIEPFTDRVEKYREAFEAAKGEKRGLWKTF